MPLRIVEEHAFDGPNLWFGRPVVRAIVTGEPTAGGAGSRELRLRIEALDRNVDRAQIDSHALPAAPVRADAPWLLAWAAVGLQRLAGDEVAFFTTRAVDSAGSSEVVVECLHPQTGMLALRLALQSLNSPSPDDHERMAKELEYAFSQRLVPVAAVHRPTAELACILAAARARGIPITSIDPRGIVRELGHGVYRRRLRHTSTSNTSYIGTLIARDKQRALHYLAECGLPVPETLIARDAEWAVANARQIGFPVVIKPNDEGNSAGLHLDVRDEDEVRTAFADAARTSRSGTVVVQRFLPERHYRIVVAGNRIVATAERIAAHVVGDGEHSIRELAEIENQRSRRGPRRSDRLKPLVIDETTVRLLEKQGWTLDEAPPEGVVVNLQRIDDLETGGEAIMQAGTMHPDNERIIVSAVQAMELDIAGVDLIAADLETSIWETSGGILEVNCDTGFALIQHPTSGDAIDPGPAVIASLFPAGAPVRVPLIAVTGDRDTAEVARLTGRLLACAGTTTGIAVQGELYLGKTRLTGIDGTGIAGKRRILLNPAVEMAVLEISPDEIVATGLAFEQCDVAVVSSCSGVAPGVLGPAEAVVCRTVVDGGWLVIPGDDAEVVVLAQPFGRELAVYGSGERRAVAGRSVWQCEVDGRTVLEIVWGDAGSTRTLARALCAAELAAIAATLAAGLSLDAVDRAVVECGIVVGVA